MSRMANPCLMIQSGRRAVPSLSPTNTKKRSNRQAKPTQPTKLSDEEMRQRIFSNATVLFPSSNSHLQGAYEIVYGSRPRSPVERLSTGEDSPWQYAMLVRRNPSGDFTPLIRGTAWSSVVSWSMALQGLLDITAAAIHKKLGAVQVPPLGINEELPRYSPSVAATQ